MGTIFLLVTAMAPLLSSSHSYCMLSTRQLFVELMGGTGQLEEKVLGECAGIQCAATVWWPGVKAFTRASYLPCLGERGE